MQRVVQQMILWASLAVMAVPAVVCGQFNYSDNGDGTCTIVKYTGSGDMVSIPNMLDGRSVVCIGSSAFYNCSHPPTSVTIPDSVTNIDSVAFTSSTCLTGITVNVSNLSYSSIDGVLFDKSQKNLVAFPTAKSGSYVIPGSVINIGYSAFCFCSSLTNVTIPNSVTNITKYAFQNCANLKSVTIPNGVTSIGEQTFMHCTSLTSVMIPNSVTNIDYAAFYNCTSLTNVMLSCRVINIGGYAFNHCSSLISLMIPDSVTDIGYAAFSSCTRLTSVIIDNRVINIGSYAFNNCTRLTNVYFLGDASSNSTDTTIFSGDPYTTTVYYMPNTTGWGATFCGRPAILWNPQAKSDANFGIQGSCFGFTITNAGSPTIIVDACTNLTNPIWVPVSTNTLTGGASYFSDPAWTNYPGRFYRFRLR